jgi:hypothetical protein
MIAILCFVVAALGGLGAEAIWSSVRMGSVRLAGRLATAFGQVVGLGVGAAGLIGVAVCVYLLSRLGATRLDQLSPHIAHGYLGFWMIAGCLALMSAVGFIAAGLVGHARVAAVAGLGLLVLAEAWLFAPHYQPKVPPSDVAPPTALTTWLQEHTSDTPFAATATTIMVPDTATLYGLYDVRTYDAARSMRARMFWSTADPDFHEQDYYTWLARPGIEWLALAGVRYVLTPQGEELPGTTPVFRADGVTAAEVPNRRPFAWTATSWSLASDPQQARARLIADVLGPPVLEGAASPPAGPAQPGHVVVVSREPGTVDLRVSAPTQQVVIVQQSWVPGWNASIDGRPTKVYPANLDFQGVIVPAGQHELSLRYQPINVTVGLALSSSGLAAIILLLILDLAPRALIVVRNWRAPSPSPSPGSLARGRSPELDRLSTRDRTVRGIERFAGSHRRGPIQVDAWTSMRASP